MNESDADLDDQDVYKRKSQGQETVVEMGLVLLCLEKYYLLGFNAAKSAESQSGVFASCCACDIV
jgi:hypothetical protein